MSRVGTVFILITLIGITSCNRKIGSIFSKKDTLEVKDPEFEYLSAKAKFKFEHNNNKVSASANFRVKNDSLIWLSISPALGIELFRILINNENILVLDRLNKRYYEYSFKELSNKYGFEFNFSMLQSVLLGNLLEPYQNQKIQKTEDYFTFLASKDGYNFLNSVGAKTMKLERLEVSSPSTKNTISVTYSDFQIADNQIFPNDILAVINYEEKKPATSIDIIYNKMAVEEGPIKFPFGVPSRYDRK